MKYLILVLLLVGCSPSPEESQSVVNFINNCDVDIKQIAFSSASAYYKNRGLYCSSNGRYINWYGISQRINLEITE